ncbi:unnamed protein product [marine sediment metagenome]|uniref:Diacylglycerol kinase n=1 Tax=marine sediment metagenome TaxID=412755 RepID=X1TVA7_9ZZZZ
MLIDIRKLKKSFTVAFKGLFYGIRDEATFRAGVIISVFVVFFTFYYPLTNLERAVVFLTMFAVLGIELMNTQVERTTNLIDKNHNPEIRIIKDLAAGAVLLIVMVAAIVAGFIFIPYIFGLK